jgi:2-polyprenyl-3-methyl-5-hydroxy-6-metoxy-1,4-benzoquinol methylase
VKSIGACPVCRSSNHSNVYVAPTTRGQDQVRWQVSECASCGHQFMNPQPSWEELQPYYDEGYSAYNPARDVSLNDDEVVRMARQTNSYRHLPLQTDKRLLDVGCGAGVFLRISKKLGAIVQGVEPSAFAAEVARKQGLDVFCGTLEEFAEETTGRFDVITSHHVMEHVPNPVETLRTMKSLLAPGGLVWIAVPNAGYTLARALKGKWHSADLPYHLMQFSPESMARAATEAGLHVRRQRTQSIPHLVEASLGQYLRYRWLIPRRLLAGTAASRMLAHWYAKRADASGNGEAIITEMVPAEGGAASHWQRFGSQNHSPRRPGTKSSKTTPCKVEMEPGS